MALSTGSFLIVFLLDNLAALLIGEIVLILILFLTLAFLVWPRFMETKTFQAGDQAMFFSTFWGLSLAALLLTLIFFLPEVDKPMAVLDALAGAVFGWFLGIYLSPHSKEEREAFTGYKSALVGLLSGVVLTKAQTLLGQRYASAKDIHLKDAEYFLIFWVSVGVCAATIYNARAYGETEAAAQKKAAEAAAEVAAQKKAANSVRSPFQAPGDDPKK